MFRLTPVVKNLLIINVLFFLADQALDLNSLALYYYQSDLFRPYQIVTHFFMHAGMGHIFFNMFALAMFGPPLEALWGDKKFLFYYLFTAIGAALLHTFVSYLDIHSLQNAVNTFAQNPDISNYWGFFDKFPSNYFKSDALQQLAGALEAGQIDPAEITGQMTEIVKGKMNVPVLGASGAVFGLLLAYGMQYPEHKLMIIPIPVPVAAKYFIPGMMVLELFLGVNNFSWDNIAHFAHLGGALFGFLLIMYWRKF